MKYRKRPVEIEAMGPLTVENMSEIAAWCDGKASEKRVPGPGRGISTAIVIHTLEGSMRADPGDYVIREVQGEFYPCKPEIFTQTYIPVVGIEPDPELVEAAELGIAHLKSRIRILQAEVSQAVDRPYRDAVGDLVALFHPRSAGLQSLREIGADDDSKISLTDVINAVRMHVEPNTLGAPNKE